MIQKSFTTKPKTNGSHYHGLARVPYDGYVAELHKGECVQTKVEVERGKSGGGNTYQFNVTFNVTGSTERDAERLFELFVKKVEHAGIAGA
ncbi:hypothetical protein [Peribacillus loiseleuriae]|uniref:Uncharacterized protein n=1 Tax=Peribacillus loiseleuriae TaxID=1679170 RepID=A0A0K9GYT8_9BACI|nr:hypothetical protein [Peribacillus loiseleuriae]KMY51775.1 hypothetical protein AC625_21450 [Peribacillus loiseleuriae]